MKTINFILNFFLLSNKTRSAEQSTNAKCSCQKKKKLKLSDEDARVIDVDTYQTESVGLFNLFQHT